jgi:hypothetical protein
VEQTRTETTAGMYKLIQAAIKDPAKVKLEVLRFIRMLNEKVGEGSTGACRGKETPNAH